MAVAKATSRNDDFVDIMVLDGGVAAWMPTCSTCTVACVGCRAGDVRILGRPALYRKGRTHLFIYICLLVLLLSAMPAAWAMGPVVPAAGAPRAMRPALCPVFDGGRSTLHKLIARHAYQQATLRADKTTGNYVIVLDESTRVCAAVSPEEAGCCLGAVGKDTERTKG